MAGLESIALAVAHLEYAQEARRGDHSLAPPVTSLFAPTSAPLPVGGTAFGQSARLVSGDLSTVLRSVHNSNSDEDDKVYESNSALAMQIKEQHQEHQQPFPVLAPKQPNLTPRVESPETAAFFGQEMSTLPFHPNSSIEEILELELTLPHVASDQVVIECCDKDVLLGRGGETNHHSGNVRFRAFVKACQPAYIQAKRRDKPKIAEKIVAAVRMLGGRFLKKTTDGDGKVQFKDVGNTKAREKTSQALREGAPELRDPAERRKRVDKPLQALSRPTKRLSLPTVLSAEEHPTKMRRVSDVVLMSSSSLTSGWPCAKENTNTFRATISADDDEETNSAPSSPKPSAVFRGPRIKFFKNKLLGEEDSCASPQSKCSL